MLSSKSQILDRIRETTATNGGVPLGVRRFELETGIKQSEWFGIHWARWGDALREAGYEPNGMQDRFEFAQLMRRYAELMSELGRLPVKGEIILKRRRDPSFPSYSTFARLGTQTELLEKVKAFCSASPDFLSLVTLCGGADRKSVAVSAQPTEKIGYVYLIKHGARREYKIGRTNNMLRREGEIGAELPEKIKPVHVISTDDPAGIEAYWHKRFDSKRKNGEWFELSADDVNAFRPRKFM